MSQSIATVINKNSVFVFCSRFPQNVVQNQHTGESVQTQYNGVDSFFQESRYPKKATRSTRTHTYIHKKILISVLFVLSLNPHDTDPSCELSQRRLSFSRSVLASDHHQTPKQHVSVLPSRVVHRALAARQSTRGI